MTKKIAALILLWAIICSSLSSCEITAEPPTYLSIGVGKISGDFSPFTRHQGADTYILDSIFTRLWNFDESGYPRCGEGTSASAESIRIFYADENFDETDAYKSGGMTAVEFTLKSGILFSNGTPLTSEDVLFSLYLAIDPTVGYLDEAIFPLVGRTEYVSQLDNAASLTEKATEILSKGMGYTPGENDTFTADESALFWEGAVAAGGVFCERIFDYVAETYCSDELAATYIYDSYRASDILENEAVRNSYAMRLWNYGSYVFSYTPDENGIYVGTVDESGAVSFKTTLEKAMEDDSYTEFVRDDDNGDYVLYGGKFIEWDGDPADRIKYKKALSDKYTTISRSGVSGFRDSAGTLYTLEGESYPSAVDFFTLMCQYYTADGVFDFARMENMEAAYEGDSFSADAVRAFTESCGRSASVAGVSGIKCDSVSIDSDDGTEAELERITLYFKGNSFDVIYKTDFYIASKDYYTSGFEAGENYVSNYGVPLNDISFADHLEGLKNDPMGAGPYVLSSYSEDEKTVYLTVNENFSSPGNVIVSDMISDVRFVDVSGKETLASSDIAVCLTPVSENGYPKKHAKTYFVPDVSYQYVLVSPAHYMNINARIAVMSLMDTPSASAGWNTSPLKYCIPSFMWEGTDVPERADGEAPLTYDGTGETAKNSLRAAGYYYSETGGLIDPDTKEKAKFTFTLLPSDKGSKIDSMFIKAAESLTAIGADAEVVYDENLMSNIYSEEGVGIYSLGWVTGPGADLYERYSLSCGGDAIKANGIQKLYEGAIIENFGTLYIDDASGERIRMTQSDAVGRLDELISLANSQISPESKKELYGKALGLISELCFELPVYQRGSVNYVREDLVDVSTVYSTPTVYKSLISEIWNIKLK